MSAKRTPRLIRYFVRMIRNIRRTLKVDWMYGRGDTRRVAEIVKDAGIEIERFTLYALIHHDHHFLICGLIGFETGMQFDQVRRKVEPDFDDIYLWMHQKGFPRNWKKKIVRLAFALQPAHEWSMRVAGLWHGVFWKPSDRLSKYRSVVLSTKWKKRAVG